MQASSSESDKFRWWLQGREKPRDITGVGMGGWCLLPRMALLAAGAQLLLPWEEVRSYPFLRTLL